MASTTFSEVRRKAKADPARRKRIENEKAAARVAIRLAEIRESQQKTQKDLAELLGTSQANVSRIERTENPYLSTLAEYIEGLGGRLEINAVFGEDVVPLARLEEVAAP